MISKESFQKILEDGAQTLRDLTATKGEEYARSEDQLANFKRSAVDAGLTPEQVWLVFYNKHMDAIKSYIKTGTEFSEPIDGRIMDAILYLYLLLAMVQESKGMGDPVKGAIRLCPECGGSGFRRNNDSMKLYCGACKGTGRETP